MIVHHGIRGSFLGRGFRASEYFDHHVLELHKRYPDSLLAMQKRGFTREELEEGTFLQINVYADDVAGYPDELFFDAQLNWHNQQFGKKGLVGAAGLFLGAAADGFVTLVQSDLVQQIYRAKAFREYKSRLENRFHAWARITLGAVVNSATRHGIETLYVPASKTITSLLTRTVDPGLFERVYDAPARAVAADPCTQRGLGYWKIDLRLRGVGGIGEYDTERLPVSGNGRTQVCILHDIEEDVDTPVPVSECRRNLERMLDMENRKQVRGTYNVLGRLFTDVAPRIVNSGHVVGFHSWNHDVSDVKQLPKVREVDLQVKGYRPPQSRITEELTTYNLSYWNFEWLASSRYSLKREDSFVERGIAHICIDIDDYGLHAGEMDYQRWRDHILQRIRESDLYVFSVHDCYAGAWIDHYDSLLDAISDVAEFRTCEDIAGRLFMAAER
jgi:hypothetical protein